MDDDSNMKRSSPEIVPKGPYNILIEESLRFEFKRNNNQIKYEAIIIGINLAIEMGTLSLKARTRS